MSNDHTRLKIAFLIPTLNPGGAERQLVNTLRALSGYDVELAVFVLLNKHALSKSLPPNVKLEVIGIGSMDPGGYVRLIKKLKAFGPDILHGQLYPGNLLSRLFRMLRPGTKVVNHIHGLGSWMKPYHILGERMTGWLAHRILTVSQRSYDIRRRREGYSKKRLSVFYNAIDTRRFSAEGPPASLPIVLGMAARLIPLKRVDRIIDLTVQLRELGLNVRLSIAGDGPERAKLESLASEYGLEEHVEFLGMVSDMPAFYKNIHLLCLASETEDLPMVLIEAMAAGRPVIASDVGGIAELTKGGIGFLVEDWERDKLAEEVAGFISNIDWQACHIHNSRFAREGFDEREYAIRLLDLYRSL